MRLKRMPFSVFSVTSKRMKPADRTGFFPSLLLRDGLRGGAKRLSLFPDDVEHNPLNTTPLIVMN